MNHDIIPGNLQGSFWLISADMGYGHHRAIYPLKKLARRAQILNANDSPHTGLEERKLWTKMQRTYEFISRTGKIPVLGKFITKLLDSLLYIPGAYPSRDRSKPTLQVRYLSHLIEKGLCRGITEYVSDPQLPLITSFYLPALAAEKSGHKKIFCIICDTDLSRAWVSEDSKNSRITYFVPGTLAADRLRSYGIQKQNIIVTGFPLPMELTGDRNLKILISNLRRRLRRLDPTGSFLKLHSSTVKTFLGDDTEDYSNLVTDKDRLTITYAVGGAGALKETGAKILESLTGDLKTGRIELCLVAGTRQDIRDYYERLKNTLLPDCVHVKIIWDENRDKYFDLFNKSLSRTDILWTKPSELSFFCALGIPIVMAPAIGPQEKCNKKWLLETGAGISYDKPDISREWIYDMLQNGEFAEAAWNGFMKAEKHGCHNIIDFFAHLNNEQATALP